jgi:prepilin-type N-terminal cleavage/methylation domain-containing protein
MPRTHNNPWHRLPACGERCGDHGRDARATRRRRRRRSCRAGFSLIEALIAIAISGALLAAAVVALDAMFKSYKQTTDSASTHIVSRIVMNRILGMVRTGVDFAPVPNDVLDADDNPLASDYFTFVSDTGDNVRIEFRLPGESADLRVWQPGTTPSPAYTPADLPGELWYVRLDAAGSPVDEQMLLSGVRSCMFTLNYDVGPRLRRATIDLVIESDEPEEITVAADAVPQTVRLIASSVPRRHLE